MTTKTPRPHAELIKAWADGAEIEFRAMKERNWREAINPGWYENHEYRIKPAPKRKVEMWQWAARPGFGMVPTATGYFKNEDAARAEYSRWTILCRIEGSRIEVEEE